CYPQRYFPLFQKVDDERNLILSFFDKGDFPANIPSTVRHIFFHRGQEIMITLYCIMKVRNRFIQSMRRKITQHFLEIAKGASGIVKMSRIYYFLICLRLFDKNITAPVSPLRAFIKTSSFDRG